jgi:hypothetical protein
MELLSGEIQQTTEEYLSSKRILRKMPGIRRQVSSTEHFKEFNIHPHAF